MIAFQDWLSLNDIANPHVIPIDLQVEFAELYGDTKWFWPQPGGQEQFLNCAADICLYGGAAGAGKSFCLLMDHIKWIHLPGYVGTVIRKTFPQIFGPKGLWDEAKGIYQHFGGKPNRGDTPKFVFPSGAEIHFRHSQHAKDVEKNWQGLQPALISVDELTHFTRDEFLYMMGRNRGVSGLESYIRMTCNPDPYSWVKDLVQWWIDPNGDIIEERSGQVRYIINEDDVWICAGTAEELIEKYPGCEPLSFTFIRGYLEDNQKLMEADPKYRAKLKNQSAAMESALLKGNWNELHDPNKMFQSSNINANRVDTADPKDMVRIAIGIDPAGSTNETSDLTGIVVVGVDDKNHGYVLADKSGKYQPNEWAKIACDLFDAYKADVIVAEKNYGGDMVYSTINNYRSDVCPRLVNASRGKELRAEPVAMLYTQNRVHHVGHNLKGLELEMRGFDPIKVKKGEMPSPNRLDALVWAINEVIAKKRKPEPRIIFM
jgi:hypothetical protein